MPYFNNHQIDLVFGVNWPPPEDIVARKISSTKYVLCASPRYIRKKGNLQSLEELPKHNYINHSSRNTHLVGLKKDTVLSDLKSKISADNSFFIKKCVLHDLGIGLFHDYVVRKEIDDGNLIELLSDEFIENQEIFMYYPKNKFTQPKVKEFVKIALESLNH